MFSKLCLIRGYQRSEAINSIVRAEYLAVLPVLPVTGSKHWRPCMELDRDCQCLDRIAHIKSDVKQIK